VGAPDITERAQELLKILEAESGVKD
jgi:hypothetical protein